MESHFCVCPAENCPRHPRNQPNGCDPCIRDNLEKGKIPACFFHAVHADMRDATDYSIKGFVEYFLRHNRE